MTSAMVVRFSTLRVTSRQPISQCGLVCFRPFPARSEASASAGERAPEPVASAVGRPARTRLGPTTDASAEGSEPVSWVRELPASKVYGLPVLWLYGPPASCVCALPAPWIRGSLARIDDRGRSAHCVPDGRAPGRSAGPARIAIAQRLTRLQR